MCDLEKGSLEVLKFHKLVVPDPDFSHFHWITFFRIQNHKKTQEGPNILIQELDPGSNHDRYRGYSVKESSFGI